MSLDDSSLYSPMLWPENVVRASGEVGPRVAWGEEIPLTLDPAGEHFQLELMLREASGSGDNGMRIEMTVPSRSYDSVESLVALAYDNRTYCHGMDLATNNRFSVTVALQKIFKKRVHFSLNATTNMLVPGLCLETR